MKPGLVTLDLDKNKSGNRCVGLCNKRNIVNEV